MQSVSAGGASGTSGGTLNQLTTGDSLSCCIDCFNTPGCGLWFFFEGFGCFNAVNVVGPDPTTQCPTGFGQYLLVPGEDGEVGDVGGPGPCGGSFEI
jgi:hypothetical protein